MHSFARVQSRMSHLRQLIKPGLVIAPVSRVSHNQVALRVDPPEGLLVRRPVREAADREQVMNMEAAVPLPATTTNRTRLPRPIMELLEFSDRPPDFLALAHTISFAVTHRSSPFSPPPWGGVWYYLPDPVHGCMVCSDASDGPPQLTSTCPPVYAVYAVYAVCSSLASDPGPLIQLTVRRQQRTRANNSEQERTRANKLCIP